jgi:DNA ligase-1
MAGWEVSLVNGSIRLPQIGWWLDAHFPTDRSFVSHAHFDHLAAHGTVLLSQTTARLMQARMPGKRSEIVLSFHERWEDPSGLCSFTLVPAGHIFGSAQALVESSHGRLLYTGDFKLRQGLSAERCETPRADVVIMETTYGRPHYRFPPTEEVLAKIAAFATEAVEDGCTPVFFGYSLGKSQEILSGLARAGLPVMLHPRVWKLTKIYESLGISFPVHRLFDASEVRGHAVIAPPQSTDSPWLRKLGPRRTATVTGWALDPNILHRTRCDAAFVLSDHADYDDLIAFVERVQPRFVYTVHGFAEDFSADLRARGVESWPLGGRRQLELGVFVSTSSSRAQSPEPAPEPTSGADATFLQLARTSEKIARTASRLEKISIVSALLKELPVKEAGMAVDFLCGRALPRASELRLDTGWALAKRALEEIVPGGIASVRTSSQQLADAGDMAAAVVATRPNAVTPTSIDAIADVFYKLAAARGPTAKVAVLVETFASLSPSETRLFVNILNGDVRIGLKESLVEEAIARASGMDPEQVRRAHLLCGDLQRVWHAACEGKLGEIGIVPFNPLQFMLASPAQDAAAIVERLGERVWLEEKYDGIRCQVHKCKGRAELYSRDLHRISASFPELIEAVLRIPRDFIADGELLAWRDGRALPFAELQRRLGRKSVTQDDLFLGAETPVSLNLYDLLHLDGTDWIDRPLSDRRAALDGIDLSPCGERVLRAPVRIASGVQEIEAAFIAAKARGNEGLMAKDSGSPYSPGRRGLAWLKLKKAQATLDVVVTAVEEGHGKRRGVLSDYTFAIRDEVTGEFLNVGKAYSGLTDAEISDLTGHFLDHSLEVRGRRRIVVPDTVLEIAFDSIQSSKRHASGYALRFPRILRIRTDKSPDQIDTLDTCRKLAEAAKSYSQGF